MVCNHILVEDDLVVMLQRTSSLSRPKGKNLPPAPATALFPPGRGISPYVADWHRAFARLDPAASLPVELWFDRGPYPPAVEYVRLPRSSAARDQQVTELYLAALVNNVLCTRGAKSLSILAETPAIARTVLQAVKRLLLLRPDNFSNMSLYFLYGLIRRVFATDFDLDTDFDHIQSLQNAALTQQDLKQTQKPTIPTGTVLSINIGQRLISLGLVTIDAAGHAVVEHLSREETWPGERSCLTAVVESTVAQARECLEKAGRSIDALSLSLAATVMEGTVVPVAEFGLFGTCPSEEIDAIDPMLRQYIQSIAPDKPFRILNDGEAQALYALHYGKPASGAAADDDLGPGDMLSVRLGACPAIHRLDAAGHAEPGFHEYGWLTTRYSPNTATDRLFTTTRLYLSHYGVAVAAHELGLLQKYRLPLQAAIPFFHEALQSDDATRQEEATQVYYVLGAHLALLADELCRIRPIGTLRLLGSQTNCLDRSVFHAMSEGFSGFSRAHHLAGSGIRLELIEEASAIAGLIGAAHAVLASRPKLA